MSNYKIIFAIVPAFTIILFGFVLDVFDPRTRLYKILDLITEKDLDIWLDKAGINRKSKGLFILIRIIVGVIIGVVFALLIAKENVWLFIIILLCGLFVGYKVLYLALQGLYSIRIQSLNEQLPYAITSISYLCYVYDVNTALIKSLDYIPNDFVNDIKILIKDIDDNPRSYQPYQNMIDRYENKLNDLDIYFSQIYRMSVSGVKEDAKILDNLSIKLSQEVDRVRTDKNKLINDTTALLGFIPVGLLVVVLSVISFLMIDI